MIFYLRREDLSKLCHKAHPPHEVSTLYHCSQQMTSLSNFLFSKIPSNYNNKSQITSPQPFSVVFLDFTRWIQLVKNPPKTWKLAELAWLFVNAIYYNL